MIANTLKIALRNLRRNKTHTLINVTGLCAGLTCSLFIMLWVQHELSIDDYHTNRTKLYQLYAREYYDGKVEGTYNMPGPLAGELKKLIPEVQYAVSMQAANSFHTFSTAGKIAKLEGAFASADLFRMFSYPLAQGTPQTALNTPLSMAISTKMAALFFGSSQQAMGQTLRFENRKDFLVTAVFNDLGNNNSRKFDYVINWDAYYAEYPGANSWQNTEPYTFIVLHKDADVALVESKIIRFQGNYRSENNTFRSETNLQRFDQVYLNSHFNGNGQIAGGRIEYVKLFTIVAIAVLLIACVNFINLATAQSVKRAREIGVRKVMGAVRGMLIRQFLVESLVLVALTVLLGLVCMQLLLPVFNTLIRQELVLPLSEPLFWAELAALTLVTGVVAGSYPALFLSSFNPVSVLKGTLRFGKGPLNLRKTLVVFQFVLSAVLIISTIIVSRQVNYIRQKNIGYDREHLVYIPLEGALTTQYNVFKTAALQVPGVAAVSSISTNPTFINDGTTSVDWDGKPAGTTSSFAIAAISYDFIRTMKLELLQGRDYSKEFPADRSGYIINETAAKKIGYQHPLGREINMWGNKGEIIGVVKDFHIASLRDHIQPLLLRFSNGGLGEGNLLVRIQPGKTAEALRGLAKISKTLNPAFPFTYSFSDEQYQQLYESEQVAGRLSNVFAVLAILISCLGLLGLAMFTASQRVKEIGIRKVLGASVRSIFALLSAEFLVLAVLAMLIASPVAWFAMNRWLQEYAYHVPVQWWMFAAAGGLIVVIAFLTISFQVIRASLANPADSLRRE